MDYPRELTGVATISRLFRLPIPWIKAEVNAGRLPALRVGKRLIFDPRAVEKALLDRAASKTEAVANA